jgi:hypothetical protein
MVTQVQSSMVQGSRLIDENCTTTLNCEPDNLSYDRCKKYRDIVNNEFRY